MEKIVTLIAVLVSLFFVYVMCGTVAWCFLQFEYKKLFKVLVIRIGYNKPKKMFYESFGNSYTMARKNQLDKYKTYHIPKFLENRWLLDMKKLYENKMLQAECAEDAVYGARAYYNVTMHLDGVEGMAFLRKYIQEHLEEFTTEHKRELMDVAVFMTVYMVRDDLDVRKSHLLWELETLRKMIHSEITFSESTNSIYVIETPDGKVFTQEWWKDGARIYNADDEKDAIRYLISICKGALGELMYYGSGFSNSDIIK